jgi:hypothetical protein
MLVPDSDDDPTRTAIWKRRNKDSPSHMPSPPICGSEESFERLMSAKPLSKRGHDVTSRYPEAERCPTQKRITVIRLSRISLLVVRQSKPPVGGRLAS